MSTPFVIWAISPRAGNRLGSTLLEWHSRASSSGIESRQIMFMDLSDDRSVRRTLQTLHRLHRLSLPVVILVAGGDGSLAWAMDTVAKSDVPLSEITWGMVPFGTGNDLSQATGWGRTLTVPVKFRHVPPEYPNVNDCVRFMAFVRRVTDERLSGCAIRLDTWHVGIRVFPGGAIDPPSRPIHEWDYHRRMIICCSLGAMGYVGIQVERRRKKTRLGNIMAYTWSSLKALMTGVGCVGSILDSITWLERDPQTAEWEWQSVPWLEAKTMARLPAVEFTVQNVPALWGRHIDLWRAAKPSMHTALFQPPGQSMHPKNWTPHKINDGMLESFVIRSIRSYFWKQFPFGRGHLTRIGQFHTPLELALAFAPFPQRCSRRHRHGGNGVMGIMIDGEFRELKFPEKIAFWPGETIQILCAPSAPLLHRQVV